MIVMMVLMLLMGTTNEDQESSHNTKRFHTKGTQIFLHITLFGLHNGFQVDSVIIYSFYGWGKLRHTHVQTFARVTQLVCGRTGVCPQDACF